MKVNFKSKKMRIFNGSMLTIWTIFLSVLIPSTIDAFKNERILDNVLENELQTNQSNFLYKSDFASYEELKENHKELSKEIVGESSVLLKNNDCLPLKNPSKLTLFSRSSVDLIYSGTGSNSIKLDKKSSLKDALEDNGFEVNPVLYAHYQNSPQERIELNIDNPNYDNLTIAEDNIDLFTKGELTNSYLEYNDYAIITILRMGGEGYDLPLGNFDKKGNEYQGQNGYLTLQKEELELIKKVKRYFQKTIVLLNTPSSIDVSPLLKDEYEVNSILWIGYPGEFGLDGVAKILKGEINPSGKLPHTYIKDISNYPSTKNFNDFSFKGTTSKGEFDCRNNYIIYQEGLYVGYRYYETAYENSILSNYNFDYDNEVIYPFGYGLSYTTFKKELIGVDFNKEDDTYSLYIKVKNTGNVEGKDVVQIYSQSEFTDFDLKNNIEKPSVNLSAFKKTKSLRPNEKDIISLEISLEDLKSYDSTFFQTYFLGKGNYYFTVADNSHDAIKNIIAFKNPEIANNEFIKGNSNNVYSFYNSATKIYNEGKNDKITNQFDEADINYYLENKVTYFSRKDFASTFPTPLEGIEYPITNNSNIAKNKSIVQKVNNLTSDSSVKLFDLLNEEFTHPNWTNLLSKISNEDLANLIGIGGFGTSKINSIVYPGSKDSDGPSGISGNAYGGKSGTCFPSQCLIAASMDIDLVNKLGEAIANEAIYLKTTGLYAPGINIQRHPYAGRNNEYYSEDPYLSGILGANFIQGTAKKGIITYPKHLILNDQENHRHGVCVFANEQTIREIYLRPFEIVIKNSPLKGLMTSFNRVGFTWTGANKNLLTNVIRNELGFNGVIITDYTSGYDWMNPLDAINSGLDLFLASSTDVYKNQILDKIKSDGAFKASVINSAKRILYSYLHSSAMNGYTKDNNKLKNSVSVWKISVITIDVITSIVVLYFLIALIISFFKKASR